MREMMILGSLTTPLYLFYCKCKKGTGNPITIKCGKYEWNTHDVKQYNTNARMTFNNTPPSIARRGATTALVFVDPIKVTKHKNGSYTLRGQITDVGA